MKFWEICSKPIFRLVAGRSLRKMRANSIEKVLIRAMRMVDLRTQAEIRAFVKGRQTPEGGFADRGGKCDLYYSLFGCFIAEAMGIDEVQPALEDYVRRVSLAGNLDGIHRKCAVILWSKLFGAASIPAALRKPGSVYATYSEFINLLAGYYAEDYLGLYRIQRKFTSMDMKIPMPCAVTAAQLVLLDCTGKDIREMKERMGEFYKENGSYAPVRKAPSGDLLSTGVALYALRFVHGDLRINKPACLDFIDSLYWNGGFCATDEDEVTDVEYTFYGLLGLGALSDYPE